MAVPWVYWLAIGLLAFGLLVGVVVLIRLWRAVRRLWMVRGWLADYLDDHVGSLRARAAAMRVAAAEIRKTSE